MLDDVKLIMEEDLQEALDFLLVPKAETDAKCLHESFKVYMLLSWQIAKLQALISLHIVNTAKNSIKRNQLENKYSSDIQKFHLRSSYLVISTKPISVSF